MTSHQKLEIQLNTDKEKMCFLEVINHNKALSMYAEMCQDNFFHHLQAASNTFSYKMDKYISIKLI